MKDIILKAIQAHLNRDPQADTLFHEAVVSRSRIINESIRLGREFVLDDLEKPTAPNLNVDGADLLASVDADDVTDPDEETELTPLPDISQFDADHDGSLSSTELAAAAKAFADAFAQIEKEFAELEGDDDDDTDSDDSDELVESVDLIRDPDGKITLHMTDPSEGSKVAPVSASNDMADVTSVSDELSSPPTDDSTDTDTTDVPEDDTAPTDDVGFADETPAVKESRIPRRTMSEARKAYLSRKQ